MMLAVQAIEDVDERRARVAAREAVAVETTPALVA